MFENPRRGRQARNFTTNVPKILGLKSSSEQIFFRKLSSGAPDLHVAVNGHYKQEGKKSKTCRSKLTPTTRPKNNYLRTMHGSFFKELKMKANEGHKSNLSTGRRLKNTAICRKQYGFLRNKVRGRPGN